MLNDNLEMEVGIKAKSPKRSRPGAEPLEYIDSLKKIDNST